MLKCDEGTCDEGPDKGVKVVWVGWMNGWCNDEWRLNSACLPCSSHSSFLPLKHLIFVPPTASPPTSLSHLSLALLHAGLYTAFEILFGFLCLCLPLNECVGHLPAYLCSWMLVGVCEYVLYTCVSIRESDHYDVFEHVHVRREFIFSSIFTHLCVGMCVCCVGLYSNRRA